MISIGGSEDTEDFSKAAATDKSRKLFAANIAMLCKNFGFDGVEIDWKYPGGYGNAFPSKAKEAETFPALVSEIRRAIGPTRLLSINAPAKYENVNVYSEDRAAVVWLLVDWVNIMTYDVMCRRDTIAKYHTDVKNSIKTIDHFVKKLHLDPKKINLGFTMYAKYFTIDTTEPCDTGLGCSTKLLETSDGAGKGKTGFVSFEAENYETMSSNMTETDDNTCGVISLKKCPEGQCCSAYGFWQVFSFFYQVDFFFFFVFLGINRNFLGFQIVDMSSYGLSGDTPEYCDSCQGSEFGSGCTGSFKIESTPFQKAMANGITDQSAGCQYYYDQAMSLFWTWDTPDLIARKFDEIVISYNLGGVIAWSIGQDSYNYSHILALKEGVKKMRVTGGKPKSNLAGRIKLGEHVGTKTEIRIATKDKPWWKKLWPF